MKSNLDNYLGSKPFLYGRKILKDMGVKGHYINEGDVVDFLGYEIKTIDPAEYAEFGDVIGEIFDDTCAVLLRQQNLILLWVLSLACPMFSLQNRSTLWGSRPVKLVMGSLVRATPHQKVKFTTCL